MNYKHKITNHKFKASANRYTLLDVHIPEQFKPNKTSKLILFLHGYKGYKDWGAWRLLSEKLVKNGIGFAKLNFSHNGGTPEQPIDFPDLEAFSKNTYSKEVADVGFAIDELYRLLFGFEFELILMGHSRGGGIAILSAARDLRIAKLITLSSIDNIEKRFPSGKELEKWATNGVRYVKNARTGQEMPHLYAMYEDWLTHKDHLDIEKSAEQLKIPVLLLHGTKDTTVDCRSSKNLNNCIKNAKLQLIQEANHTFGSVQPWRNTTLPPHLEKVTNEIINWI